MLLSIALKYTYCANSSISTLSIQLPLFFVKLYLQPCVLKTASPSNKPVMTTEPASPQWRSRLCALSIWLLQVYSAWVLSNYFTMFSQKRMIIVALWLRIASPRGSRYIVPS